MREASLHKIGRNTDVLVALTWVPCIEDEATDDVLSEYVDRYAATGIVTWRNRRKVSLGLDLREETDALVPSLALLALNTLQGNWVGIFVLGDKYWLGASLNNHVYPLSDLVFDGDDEKDSLLQEFEELRQLINPTTIYAPAHFEIEGAEEYNLDDIKEIPSEALVRNPEPSLVSQIGDLVRLNSKKLIVTSVFVAAAWIGASQYSSYQERVEAAANKEAQTRAQLEAENRRQIELDKANQAFRRKWGGLPLPSQHVEACRSELFKLRRPIAGWVPVASECSDATVTLLTERNKGSLRRLQTLASSREAEVLVQADGRVELKALWKQPRARGDEDLLEQSAIEAALQNWAAANNAELNVNIGDSVGKTLGSEKHVFQSTFNSEGVRVPADLAQLLDQIPGTAIKKMEFTEQGWKITGVIYHV